MRNVIKYAKSSNVQNDGHQGEARDLLIEKFVEAKPNNYKKIKTMYRNIYPVEITEVDKDRNMIKIHFKGYGWFAVSRNQK